MPEPTRTPKLPSLLLALLLVGLAGAATSRLAAAQAGGTTTTSKGVKEPPFYRGDAPSATAAARLALILKPAAGIPESWLPQTELTRLAAEMNDRLARQRAEPLLAIEPAARVAAPTVYLGCAMDETEECSEEERYNVLATTSGTPEWRRRAAAAAAVAGVERILAIELQVAPHWIHQRGLKGKKEARLGTGYVQPLPWLTSLDTPVWVLQLTGVVVDASGTVQRSGAEGIWALRTPFRASVLGSQKILSEADVEHVRAELRREDLPGQPLAWEAALDQIVAQLLGG